MRVLAWVVLELVRQVPIFTGEHHRRVAPSTPRVGATEVASAKSGVAFSVREHLLREGHNDNEDLVSLHPSDHDRSDVPKIPFKFNINSLTKRLLGTHFFLVLLNAWKT